MNKEHLKDIRLNADNKYEYMGDVYKWEADQSDIRKLVALSAAAFVLEIVAGCIPDSGTDKRPVLMIPFAIALIMSIILIFRVGSLFFYKKKGAKTHIKKKIENWMPASSFFVGVNSIIIVIASFFYENVSLIFILCQMVASVTSFGAFFLVKRIVWKKNSKKGEKNN